MNSKFGFRRRQQPPNLTPACIVQPIQVKLQQLRLRRVQITGALLSNSQILNSFRYSLSMGFLKPVLLKIFAVLILFGNFVCLAGSEDFCDRLWAFSFQGTAAGGEYIGQDKKYVELSAFIVSDFQRGVAYFSDVRGFIIEDDCFASNVGLGFRTLQRDLNLIFGGNIYYDYFQGDFGGFNRLGIGVEILGKCLDFRANSYIPVKSKFLCKFTSSISASCLGHLLTLGLQNSNSVALPRTPKSPGR